MKKTLIERLKDEEMYVDAVDEAIEYIESLEIAVNASGNECVKLSNQNIQLLAEIIAKNKVLILARDVFAEWEQS